MEKSEPVTYLQWEEPKDYRRTIVDKKLPPLRMWVYVLVLAFVFGLCVVIKVEEGKKPRPLWMGFLGSASIIGGYYTSYLLSIKPKKIEIREDGILTKTESIDKLWKYEKLCWYSIESEAIDKYMLKVLCLKPVKWRSGKELRFGISSEVSIEELNKILSDKIEDRSAIEKIDVNRNLV